jgi:hypothetical protein
MPTEKTPMEKATSLLNAIRDAHHRMATNRDPDYRMMQDAKVMVWLEELTTLYEKNLELCVP